MPEREGTLGALIGAYRASPEFVNLAPRTQYDYQRIFDYLSPLRAMPVIEIDRPFLIALRDRAHRRHRRRFANYVVQVARLLFAWGLLRGWCDVNPAIAVPAVRRPRDEPYRNRVWTESELAAVLSAAPSELKVAVALGAYTGLREGDVIRLPWSSYDGHGLEVRQRKTSEPLWIPAHSELREILDAAPRRSPIIVVGARGRPYTEAGFRACFFKLVRNLANAKSVDAGLTFHGLRHTLAKRLADSGCDTRTIMAITGHRSESMVALYTREADQRRRAKAAVTRLKRSKNEKWKTRRTEVEN
ncbi:MAG: tyrosine-type recombinase/integrase [Pseudomonadota bacterium]